MRTRRLAVALSFAVASLAPSARAEAAREPAVSIGPDLGVAWRAAKHDGSGIAYGAGAAYGAHAQMVLARWLRASIYWVASSHALDVPSGGLAAGGDVTPEGSLSSYVLGARLQPTLALGSRARAWLSVGAGWGKLRAPTLRVASPGGDVASAPRDGVMLELPVGLGGQLDVYRRLVSVGADVAFGPVISQTGDLYDRVQVVDAGGRLGHVGGLPEPASSLTALLSVTLSL